MIVDLSELDKPAVATLEHAMQPIVNEMFQNGPEEGCRIWEDATHPLHQAIVILLHAQTMFISKEQAAALLEQHRRMEEGPLSL